MTIPIIDLFAGPGGLGEGFSSVKADDGKPYFKIGLSVEKDKFAHQTLLLRSVFRHLNQTGETEAYYQYLRKEIDENTFRAHPAVAGAYKLAETEARCIELGKYAEDQLDDEIEFVLRGSADWVLIGGPPCQAYSVAGRSRRTNDCNFEEDEKHFLYREYLRIIRVHKPTLFVMENVKGLLSSKHSGRSIFERIIHDLSSPEKGLEYEIRSFTTSAKSEYLKPNDYIIKSEDYGIPQSRHRVILLGVRREHGQIRHSALVPQAQKITVSDVLSGLPKIRSRLSRNDSPNSWGLALEACKAITSQNSGFSSYLETTIEQNLSSSPWQLGVGASFMEGQPDRIIRFQELDEWISDETLGGICQHEARSHMSLDLSRYFFASCFAEVFGSSPSINDYPEGLLPNHRNIHKSGNVATPFKDRFKVQRSNEPGTTVVAHIAKDGHYYIHYDPSQCRTLTVREAARLQTFPDNYYFVGNRTEQYTQVGNAVPPLLAFKIGSIVRGLLEQIKKSPVVPDREKTGIGNNKLEKKTATEQQYLPMVMDQ